MVNLVLILIIFRMPMKYGFVVQIICFRIYLCLLLLWFISSIFINTNKNLNPNIYLQYWFWEKKSFVQKPEFFLYFKWYLILSLDFHDFNNLYRFSKLFLKQFWNLKVLQLCNDVCYQMAAVSIHPYV